MRTADNIQYNRARYAIKSRLMIHYNDDKSRFTVKGKVNKLETPGRGRGERRRGAGRG